MNDKENQRFKRVFESNQLFNTKYLIMNVFTMEQLKELQIDIEEAIVNKE